MKKNSNLKKKIGENLFQFLTRNFSSDFLEENLPKIFGQLCDCREIIQEDFSKLKIILNEFAFEKQEERKSAKKTAKELLSEAGYIIDDGIKTKKDYLKYEKYYKESEKLCKFSSYNATKRYSRLFWIIKKNINDIKREDFSSPKRQDEYGTSCCSIGISEDKQNISQICNRYNNKVSAPDNTFGGNLENIAEGLTDAMNRDYSLFLGKNNFIELENFYTHSGKYFFYSHEINGVKYGKNTINGRILPKERYIIFDNNIIDLSKKECRRGNPEGEVIFTFEKYSDIVLKIEKGRLISFSAPKLEEVGSYCLIYANNLQKFSAPKLKKTGDYFLRYANNLQKFSAPKLEEVGSSFLEYAENLQEFYAPKLEKTGDYFLRFSENLQEFSAPKLEGKLKKLFKK